MRASLLFVLLLAGCFGCEAETKKDPEAQMIGAWVMQIGDQPTILYATSSVQPGEVTVIHKVNGREVRRERRTP